MLKNRWLKIILSFLQAFSAILDTYYYLYILDASGGSDHGRFFAQVIVPEIILVLVWISGLIFMRYYWKHRNDKKANK
jgi:hypothetical protein